MEIKKYKIYFREAGAFIAGKLEAINAALDILERYA